MTRPIACPFCGLVCDDLLLERAAASIAAAAPRPRRDLRARRAIRDASHRRPRGVFRRCGRPRPRPCSAGAQQPSIAGLGTDIAGVRARAGARRPHRRASSIAGIGGAVPQPRGAARRAGWIATTLRRDRATAPMSCCWSAAIRRASIRASSSAAAQPHRALSQHRAVGEFVSGRRRRRRRCSARRAGAGRGGIAGRRDRRARCPGRAASPWRAAAALPLAALGTLAEKLKAARYGAVLWERRGFRAGGVQIAVGVGAAASCASSRSPRAASACRSAAATIRTASSQAMLWQAGWPRRISLRQRHARARSVALRRRAAARGAAKPMRCSGSPRCPPTPPPSTAAADRGADRPPMRRSAVAPAVADPRRRAGARPCRRGGARRRRRRAAADGGAARARCRASRRRRRRSSSGSERRDDHRARRRPRRSIPRTAIDGEVARPLHRRRPHRRRARQRRADRRSYDMRGRVVMAGRHRHPQPHRRRQGQPRAPADGRGPPRRAAMARGALTRSRRRPGRRRRASPPATAMRRWATPRRSSPRWCRRNARHAHMEMGDTPIIDHGAYVDARQRRAVAADAGARAPSRSGSHDYVGWMMHATAGARRQGGQSRRHLRLQVQPAQARRRRAQAALRRDAAPA